MDGRFSSADHDPIEESDSFFEELEKYLLTDEVISELSELLRQDEFGIVAEPTPKIATRCKHDGCNMARIVQEGGLFECGKLHTYAATQPRAVSPLKYVRE